MRLTIQCGVLFRSLLGGGHNCNLPRGHTGEHKWLSANPPRATYAELEVALASALAREKRLSDALTRVLECSHALLNPRCACCLAARASLVEEGT